MIHEIRGQGKHLGVQVTCYSDEEEKYSPLFIGSPGEESEEAAQQAALLHDKKHPDHLIVIGVVNKLA